MSIHLLLRQVISEDMKYQVMNLMIDNFVIVEC